MTFSWKKQLTVNRKTGDAEPTIMNALLILQNDPLLRGKIAKNEFLTRIVLRGPVPWRCAVKDRLSGELWSDTDDAGLLLYLENSWNLNAEQKIRYAMGVHIIGNQYHHLALPPMKRRILIEFISDYTRQKHGLDVGNQTNRDFFI